MGDVVEVELEPLFQTVFGLSHILFATTFAGDAVDNVVAIACHVGLGIVLTLHQIRRYPAPYISKAGQKATPSNILQPFIPHCFPLQSPYINSRPFISSPHYFYSSPIRFRICPTPAQPTSILTRIVFPADQQPILNDQFYVEEMPEEIVIVVKLIYSDRTHST